jgi:fatty-acyl-CoA synthase
MAEPAPTPVDIRTVAPAAASPVSRDVLDTAPTLTDAIAELAARHPDWTWGWVLDRDHVEHPVVLGPLWTRAGEVAAALQARGVRPGDVVLCIATTSVELLATYVGVLRAGAVPSLLATPGNRYADWSVYTRRIGGIALNARATAVVTTNEIADALRAGGVLAGAAVLTPDDLPAGIAPPSAPPRDPAALGTLQYSSGSTGAPKGIRWRHDAILEHLRAVRDALGLETSDVTVNWIPLYHDMGLVGSFLLPLVTGMRAVLIPTMDFVREPEMWLWAIHRRRGTLSWSPNFGYAVCASRLPDDAVAGLDLASWRIAISASEPVLASTSRAFVERFARYGLPTSAITPGWGLAETVTISTTTTAPEPLRAETIDRQVLAREGRAVIASGDGFSCVSLGRALPGCTVEIRDGARVLPERGVGTIWVRSTYLFAGYHDDAASTERVVVDGWLDTGDQGYLADGELFFVARAKDVIVIGGDKYAPHDVEAAVNTVAGVRQGCAVAFGVLDDARGTEDLAVVAETSVAGDDARAALAQDVRRAVTAGMGLGVRHLLLVDPGGVEKTSSGKLARRATRARWAETLGIPPG